MVQSTSSLKEMFITRNLFYTTVWKSHPLTTKYGYFHTNTMSLAGHSHWANIKHKKARKDNMKMVSFGKIAASITSAVKSLPFNLNKIIFSPLFIVGGPNPSENNLLNIQLEAARKAGMPKDKVTRAINKVKWTIFIINLTIIKAQGIGGTGDEVVYEGKGPNGTLFIVVCNTDNRNRTAQKVKSAFSRNEYNLTLYSLFTKIQIKWYSWKSWCCCFFI